jgi:hypothetical protein
MSATPGVDEVGGCQHRGLDRGADRHDGDGEPTGLGVADDGDVARVAVDHVADPAEELLGEEAVLLDGGDLVAQAAQLEGRRCAEPAQADDEDVVLGAAASSHRWCPPAKVEREGSQPATGLMRE